MIDDAVAAPALRSKVLLVSILTLGRPQNVLRQLEDLPSWLVSLGAEEAFVSRIVVRNNDPNVAVDALAARLAAVEAEYPELSCTLIADVPNNGFGAGHNSNIACAPSDYVLILNDDLGFPNISWLSDALAALREDPRVACVGSQENPQHLNPLFGNGLLPGAFHLHTITYAEASVLLFDRGVFDRVGGFAEEFAWAMCEDADLSLRVQQLGYRLAHVPIPHQHWRSTSFNTLPGSVKSSIQEHNRAALFANWHDSLTSGRVGALEVYDIWGDGLGDLLCALPHLLARLSGYPAERLSAVVINTRHPALVEMLGLRDVRITSAADVGALRMELANEGIASLRSSRDVNFSLPFNIHPLIAGTLGIAPCGPEDLVRFAALLQALPLPTRHDGLEAGRYCVVHLEFERNHEGRALSADGCAQLLDQCAALFETIVLVGKERRLLPKLTRDGSARVIDLQGSLSLARLISVVAHAQHFVGIDSFPAHVAAAAGVPAAVFFGAIHALARAWNEERLWPLTAALDCIGCYHTHLEPSVPFCMRRDQACTSALTEDAMAATLRAMIAGEKHSWAAARIGLQQLQAKMLKLACFHPAPPERLFRTRLANNEHMSEMIYRMTDQMGQLLRGQYHNSTMAALTVRVQETQSELYETKVELGELRRRLRERRAEIGRPSPAAPHATHIVQLSSMKLEAVRCRTVLSEQWLHVDAVESDPQLLLPPILGHGNKVQLRLSYISDAEETLQVYWAIGTEGFSAERIRTIATTASLDSANIAFFVPEGEVLQLRIDPTTAIGRCRIRGTLGGVFSLLDTLEPELARAGFATAPAALERTAGASGSALFESGETATLDTPARTAAKRVAPRPDSAKRRQKAD